MSGGLVALGLMATAADIGTAFYVLALTLLPTLAFIGFVTFHRVLQNGVEDLGYAMRIARLRSFYFEYAPELDAYLLSVPPERRLTVQGLRGGWWQHFLTIAGMTAVITSVLAGAGAALLVVTRYQHAAWTRQRRVDLVPRRDAPGGDRPSLSNPSQAGRIAAAGRIYHRSRWPGSALRPRRSTYGVPIRSWPR